MFSFNSFIVIVLTHLTHFKLHFICGVELIQYDWYPDIKRKYGHRRADRENIWEYQGRNWSDAYTYARMLKIARRPPKARREA